MLKTAKIARKLSFLTLFYRERRTGEGSIGDQTLTKGNKAIIDAAENGKPIYLYVKFGPQEYYTQGIMKLLEYKTIQAPDKNGDTRKEYVFILERMWVKQ